MTPPSKHPGDCGPRPAIHLPLVGCALILERPKGWDGESDDVRLTIRPSTAGFAIVKADLLLEGLAMLRRASTGPSR